jgi:hypothetical protein
LTTEGDVSMLRKHTFFHFKIRQGRFTTDRAERRGERVKAVRWQFVPLAALVLAAAVLYPQGRAEAKTCYDQFKNVIPCAQATKSNYLQTQAAAKAAGPSATPVPDTPTATETPAPRTSNSAAIAQAPTPTPTDTALPFLVPQSAASVPDPAAPPPVPPNPRPAPPQPPFGGLPLGWIAIAGIGVVAAGAVGLTRRRTQPRDGGQAGGPATGDPGGSSTIATRPSGSDQAAKPAAGDPWRSSSGTTDAAGSAGSSTGDASGSAPGRPSEIPQFDDAGSYMPSDAGPSSPGDGDASANFAHEGDSWGIGVGEKVIIEDIPANSDGPSGGSPQEQPGPHEIPWSEIPPAVDPASNDGDSADRLATAAKRAQLAAEVGEANVEPETGPIYPGGPGKSPTGSDPSGGVPDATGGGSSTSSSSSGGSNSGSSSSGGSNSGSSGSSRSSTGGSSNSGSENKPPPPKKDDGGSDGGSDGDSGSDDEGPANKPDGDANKDFGTPTPDGDGGDGNAGFRPGIFEGGGGGVNPDVDLERGPRYTPNVNDGGAGSSGVGGEGPVDTNTGGRVDGLRPGAPGSGRLAPSEGVGTNTGDPVA